MAISYTLIEDVGTDIHRFKLADGSATIEIVDTPHRAYLNVYQNGVLKGKELTHRQFITNFYEPNDGSEFGILVYRADELYVELTS